MSATNRGRIWGTFGILAVLVLWGASAGANFWAGFTLTDDPNLRAISGAVSVSVDILKAVALFVIVAALANRRWVVTGTAVLVFALCSAWSLRSAVYTASVIFSTAEAKRGHDAQVQKNDAALLAIKQQRLGFLSQQKVEVDSKSRRSVVELATDENERTASEFAKLAKELEDDNKKFAEQTASIPTDPIALMLQIDSRYVITATALFFAALVEFTSGAGFWMIAQARTPKGPTRQVRERAEREPSISLPNPPTGGNVVQLPIATRLSPRALIADALDDVVVHGGPKDRELTAVITQRVKARLPADFRFANPQNVAMMLKELIPGVEKRKVGGQMYFYGVKLKSTAANQVESRQPAVLSM
jgi:hypothetical protein